MSSLGYLDLCRLCLVKDRVSVPIFEGEGDVRQICLKITACLPVKVDKEDRLPKKICDDCVYKVELCYQFWHTTANAEKQLLQWLGEVNMEDKQGYNVLNPNGMKPGQSNENRLDGAVMQQVTEHQNNMNISMMDNMGLNMPMMMSSNAQQQITSVPMDNSGSSVQNVQPVAGPSTQTIRDQITQNQTDAPTQQEEEEESSDEEENSDDECDGDEGLPIKEESEEDPNNRTIEPTTFVNVSLACDEPGPSGLQQQKIADMPEMVMSQPADVDPKTGILEVGEGIGQGIKIERSEEESEGYNHVWLYSNSIVEELLLKEEEKEVTSEEKGITSFDATHGENLKNTSINAEKRKVERSERARYECSTCHATFTLHGRYKQHMVKHSDERPYKCTVCEKSFKRMSEMNNHMQIHTGVTYTCDMCSLVSRNKVSLRAHVRRVHRRDFRHRCEQCGRGFISKYDLEDHKTRHLGTKSFVCDDCGNAFLQKSYLTAHKRAMHEVQTTPKYQCDLCNKSFASERNLRNHASVHSHTFLCAQCGKEFGTSNALKQHERVHTGEKPYQCKSCPKAFARIQALRVHRVIHTGDRPYKCDICGRAFTQRSSMKKHRRRHPESHVSTHPTPLLLNQLELIRKPNK